MDASLGGFHAMDSWRNDIAGEGKLTKNGSGTLRLGGKNSYAGGTQITAGTLQADSDAAFGKGNVYVGGGTLICNAAAPTRMAGAYTQLAGTTLQMNIGGGGAGRLDVAGVAAVDGTLRIAFQPGATPSVGDTLTVITSGALIGKFAAIDVPGLKVTATYTGTALLLHIDG